MGKDEITTSITTLVVQAANGYHLSDEDIKQAEIAHDLIGQLIARAKRDNK